jgi:hypothetical protein
MEKKVANVTLGAATAAHLESTLRNALQGAAAINVVVDPPVKNPTATVTLDPATVARFTEHLRKGLTDAAAINVAESGAADGQTKKV